MAKLTHVIVRADAVADHSASRLVTAVDAWIRGVVAQYHPVLERPVCPFVARALERHTLFYAPVSGCRCPEDVVAGMDELLEHFVALPPMNGPDTQLRTLVAIFVDVESRDARRVVIAAHHELKNRCTKRGLMVGEFAPGYWLASTRNPTVNVGEAPAPVLALRHMLPSDRRFLDGEDQWLAAWAVRFGADRVPLFRASSQRELAAIARVSNEVKAEAGRVLCNQGDVGHEFFLILDGEATVRRHGEKVATLGPAAFFGELALLTGYPRNATITAATDMTLLVLNRREFAGLIDSLPALAHKLLAGLAERLGEADAQSVH
jgi:CRP/FNR family cyclic AMP-dependent transcriptional regulator